MAHQDYVCNVLQARVAVGVPGVIDPAIQLVLSDVAGSFPATAFFAAEGGKNQMLDVALSAISTQAQVNAVLDNPSQPVSPPGAQIYSLSILAG